MSDLEHLEPLAPGCKQSAAELVDQWIAVLQLDYVKDEEDRDEIARRNDELNRLGAPS
jgi:hypothetical protein